MKIALVFAIVVAFLACAAFADHHVKKVADKEFLMKQRNLLRLFHRVTQYNFFKDQVEEGTNFDIEAQIGNFKHPRVVKKFISYYKKGMLPRGKPFSVYYKAHREQAIALFELFYYANDYDTFYKTACWARDRVNDGMFVYALSIAIFHRDDMKHIVLPRACEVYPHYFVDHDVIQAAYKYMMKDVGGTEQRTHVIPTNFTLRNKEQQLSYFTEDVGLNMYNLLWRYMSPSWFNVTEYGHKISRRGEKFYNFYKQLYARYILERLSNHMTDVEPFAWNRPLKTAYNPRIRYPNGEEMPPRPAKMLPTDIDMMRIWEIKNYERRVHDAIDLGYAYDEHLQTHPLYQDENGIDCVGQMIEGTYNSPSYRFYGSLFHFYLMMLGHMMDPYHKQGLAPSALEQPQTVLRDPAFYQMYKRMDYFMQMYKNRLPRYTYEQLNFEGVRVENVEVGKLYTYFEPFEFGMENAVYVSKMEQISTTDIRARMYRLNHKPFTYKIEVSCDRAVNMMVRVFLGPKYDFLGREFDLNDRRHYFVMMDSFVYRVSTGKTVIERNSHDSTIVSPDRDSYRTLYRKVQDAIDGKSQYLIDGSLNYCGYPSNLLLPKGKKGGETFTFYVIMSPMTKQGEHDFDPTSYKPRSYCDVEGSTYPDDKPMGYPFDRWIQSNDFYTPNMFFKDVIIFHKKYEEVNIQTN